MRLPSNRRHVPKQQLGFRAEREVRGGPSSLHRETECRSGEVRQGRAGLDRLRQGCFRIRWALGDGGVESELGKIHGPDRGRSVQPCAVTVSLGKCNTLVPSM